MIYIRDEGGTIRQGFNFYPRRSGSVGFQFMLGRLRAQVRYARKTGWLGCGSGRAIHERGRCRGVDASNEEAYMAT
jgi:hypothetical protein